MLWPEVPCVDLFCQGGPGAAASPAVPVRRGPRAEWPLSKATVCLAGGTYNWYHWIAFLMFRVYPVPVFTYLTSLMATTTFVLVQHLAPCVDNWEQAVAWVCLIVSECKVLFDVICFMF